MENELPKIIPVEVTEHFEIKHVESSLNITEKMKELIDSNWNKFLIEAEAKGANVWDSPVYRFEGIEGNTLKLSTIKYSEVRGLVSIYESSGLDFELWPSSIATASLVRTSDGYYVFGKRNSNSMSSSKVDFFGGSLQPSELEVNTFDDIYLNVVKELMEESGVSNGCVEDNRFLGVIRSLKLTVIFVFYTSLNINKDDFESIFDSRVEDEMMGIEFVSSDDLESYLKGMGSYRPLVWDLYYNQL